MTTKADIILNAVKTGASDDHLTTLDAIPKNEYDTKKEKESNEKIDNTTEKQPSARREYTKQEKKLLKSFYGWGSKKWNLDQKGKDDITKIVQDREPGSFTFGRSYNTKIKKYELTLKDKKTGDILYDSSVSQVTPEKQQEILKIDLAEVKIESEKASEFNPFAFLDPGNEKEYKKNITNFFNLDEEKAQVQLQKILGPNYKIKQINKLDITKGDPELKKLKKSLFQINKNVLKITKGDEEIVVNFGLDNIRKNSRTTELANTILQKDSKKLIDFVNRTMSPEELEESRKEQGRILQEYNKLNAPEVIGADGSVIEEAGPLYVSQDEKDAVANKFDANDLFTPIEKTTYKPISKFGGRIEKQTTTEQPYKDELKEAKQQLINDGVKNPTEKQITDLARDMLKQEAIINLHNQKGSDYLNVAEDSDTDAILKLGGLMKQRITSIDKKAIANTKLKITNSVGQFEKDLLDENSHVFKADEFIKIVNSEDPKIYNLDSVEEERIEKEKFLVDLGNELKEQQEMPIFSQTTYFKEKVDLYNRKIKEYNRFLEENKSEEKVVLANGTIMPKSKYDSYITSLSIYNKKIKEILELEDQQAIDISRLKEDDIKYDLVRRNYSDSEKFFRSITAGFGDQAIKAGHGLGNITAGLFGIRRLNKEQDFIDWQKARSSLTRVREKYQKDIKFENAFNKKNFGRFLVQEAQTQIPIYLTLATGTPGLSILGFGSAQDNWNRMVQEDDFYDKETSLFNYMLVSGGYGLAEILPDKFLTLPLMRRSGKALYSNWKKFRTATKPGIKNYTKTFGKRYLIYSPLTEIGSETTTTGFQNWFTGRPIIENMGHSAFSGGLFGSTFGGAPFLKGMVMQKFSDYNSYSGFRTNLGKLEQLKITHKKLKTSLKANKTKGNNTSAIESNIETVKAEIKRLNKENESTLRTIEKKVNNLSKKWFETYRDITVEQEQIRIDVENIDKDNSLSDVEKKRLIDIKHDRFTYLQNLRDVLRDDKNFGNKYAGFRNSTKKEDQDRLQEIQGQATTELINEGKLDPNDDAIDERTRIIYNTQEINKDYNKDKSILGEEFKNFQNVDQAVEFINKMDLSDAEKQRIISIIEEGGHGANIVDNKGVMTPIQVVENMAKDDRLEIKTHEKGHYVFAKAFGNNKEVFEDVAVAILDFVKKTNPNLHLKLISQVERDAFGDLKAEEVLTNFLEFVAEGKIDFKVKKNKGLSAFVANALNIGTKKSLGENVDFNFEGETDAANFLIGLGKKIKANTLTIEDVEGIKRSKIVEKTKQKSEEKTEGKAETKFSKINTRAQEFLELAKEGILNNKSLVATVNSKQSSQEDRFAAVEALIEKNWPVISKSLKFNPTGDITMQSVKDAISEQMLGIFPEVTLENGKKVNRKGTRLLDTYNKEKAVTTFLDATLRNRQAEIFTRARTIDSASKDVDLSQARYVATDLENDVVKQDDTRKRINVLNIPKVSRQAANILKDTKINEGDTHKEVIKNNEGHIGNKIFNIPDNKITKPKDNLTTSDDIVDIKTGEVITKEELDAGATGILSPSESKNIQDVFSDYNTTEQFIKILPKTNVSEKDALINEVGENIPVSRNVYGRAIGLQDRILEYFYEPLFKPNGNRARSQGKTSQVPLWTLKEKFVNPKKDVIIQFQRDLGITEKKQTNVLPTKEKRSEIGQLLKGAARTLSQQVSLSAAQRNLEAKGAPAQQIADITAAQSKTAFSKDKSINLDNATKELNDRLNKSDNIIEAKEEAGTIDPEFIDKEYRANVNSTLTYHGHAPMLTFDSKENIDIIVDEFGQVGDILNQEVANYTVFFKSDRHIPANLRKKEIVVNKDTGQKMTVRDYYQQQIELKFPKEKNLPDNFKRGKQFTGPGSKYRKGKKFSKIYGEKSSDFKEAMQTGRNYEGSGKNAVKLTIPEINQMHESMGTQLWQRINDDIREGMALEVPDITRARKWAHYLSLATNNTEHPHRQWAEFIAWTKNPLGSNSKGNTDPNSKGYKVYEWEHAMQSAKSVNYLMHSILGDEYNFNIAFELIKDNYKLIALDNYDDKVKLKGAKRTHSMGDGWTVLDPFHKRYQDKVVADVKGKNGNGINPEGIETIFDGKTMGEHYDINTKGEPRDKTEFSKNLNIDFNQILEDVTGIKSQKVFSDQQARLRGQKTKYKSIIPASAQDFKGLLYSFLGKGKKGEQQMDFFKESLIDPFARGIKELNSQKQTAANDFKNLNKKFKDVKKKLYKKIKDSDYTHDQAMRVYLWNKAGFEIPGLSKRDLKILDNFVKNDPQLKSYADAVGAISKNEKGYSAPKDYWLAENIASDLLSDGAIGNARAEHLSEFIENADIIFSPDNLNKIEAIYGSKFREALEDMLWRMKTGRHRKLGGGRLLNGYLNWLNNSVGAIMFINMRSATLQTISAANYMNWTDNNPAKAALAFGNQKQFWSWFSKIFNSDYLKQRRAGNQRTIETAEISEAVMGVENKAKAAIAWLLKQGFTPTQIADSLAIAMGGATFLPNRIETYLKQGMSQKDAEAKAWLDFQELTEENQQSARPDMISQQQASPLGRLILAFQNTPMQYARIMNKATRDLNAGRGDTRTHISKIAYYGVVQSIIFGALQSALYASLGDDEEEEFDKKKERILNQMVDSWLSGVGYGGKAVSTIKNTTMEYLKQRDRGFRADHAYTMLQLLSFSPPIGSKVRKVYGSIKTDQFNSDVYMRRGLTLDNPIWSATGHVIEGVTNAPLGRMANLMLQADNIMDPSHQWWQRVAMTLGQNTWDLGIQDPDIEAIKLEIKEEKKVLKAKERKRKKAEKKIEKENAEKLEIEKNIEKQKEEKKEGKKVKCAAINKSGTRCGEEVVSGKSFCTVHEKVEQRADGKKSQCKKIKKNGKRCGMKTTNKSGYCYYHD